MKNRTDRRGGASNMSRKAARRLAISVALLVPTFRCVEVMAVTKTWNTATGNWSLGTNWSTSGVPGTGDVVNIVNADATTRTITYDYTNGAAVTLATFTLDQTGAGANRVNMTANTLITTTDIIGNNGVGNFTQSGGNHTVIGNFTLGNSTTAASLGIYNLSGGTLNVTNSAFIGNNGVGNFTQSTGNATFGNFTIANGTSSGSLYTFNGGNLTVSVSATVANNGTGSFVQSGGVSTFGNFTTANGTGSGNVTLNAGTMNITTNAIIGNNGISTFTHGTGSAVIGNLTLGNLLTGAGTYLLNGGNLTVNAVTTIGNNGTGSFTQTAGIHTIASAMTLGNNTSSSGFFTLGGGTLTVNGISTIGNSGSATFNQTGGTYLANGSIMVGSGSGSGLLTLSGGTTTTPVLYVGGNSTVSNGGTGTVTIVAGGNLTVSGQVRVYDSAVTFLNLAGGNLTAQSIDMNGQPGRFNWASGKLTLTGSYAQSGFAIVDSPSADIGNIGTVLILSATNVLTTNGGLIVGATGVGNLTQTGGTQSIGDILAVGYSTSTFGCCTLSGGSLIVNGAGQFKTEYIGRSGFGVFTQNGGTHLLGSAGTNYNLMLGANAGSSGTYTLNSGVFNVTGNAYVGGTNTNAGGGGVLDLVGGSMTVTGATVVYNINGAALILEGGTLNTATLSLGSPSKLIWSSGTLNLTNQGVTIDTGGLFGSTLSMGTGQTLIAALGITNNGTLQMSGGTVASSVINNTVISGFGTFSGATTLTNNGFIIQSGGTFLFSGTGGTINSNTIQGTSGRIMQIASGTLTNNGILQVGGATVSGNGTLNNTVLGVITGPGTISIANFSSSGLIEVDSGLLQVPAFVNNGIVHLGGASANLSGAGTVTNAGTIEGFGRVTAGVSNTTGTIEALGGTLILSGALSNGSAGTLRSSSGTKILVFGGSNFPTNAGLISLAGGTFDASGQSVTNTGQITGYGVISTANLVNDGAMTLTGGTTTVNGNVTNAATRTINVKDNPAIFTGFVTNNGTIKITNTKVTFTGGYSGNNYISDPSTNVFQGNVTINPGGQMIGGAGDVFMLSGAHFTIAGTFNNGGSLQSSSVTDNQGTFIQTGNLAQSANFSNSGNATFSGNQSWAANSVFTNSGGAANFQSDAGSTASATLTINAAGGQVNLNVHQHLKTLGASGSGVVTINSNGTAHTAAFVSSVTFGGTTNAWTGKIDVATNGMVVQATDAADKNSKMSTLFNQIVSGENGGDWLGNGITSASAQAHPNLLGARAVGIFDNAVLNFSSLYGANTPLDANSIIIAETYSGDTNFDGKVDIIDLSAIANHWQTDQTNWATGDLTGDGFVELADLTEVANNWQAGTGPSFSAAMAQFAVFGGGNVPEPGSLALLGAGLAALARRRR